MATPIGLALLFLMAVAPALPWRATSGEVVRHRLLVPAWIGAAHDGRRGDRSAHAASPRCSPTGSARSPPRGSSASSCSASVADAARWASRVRSRSGARLVRTRGSTAASSCTSASCSIAVVLAASSAYGANRDVRLQRGAVGDGRRATRSRTSGRTGRAVDAEDHGLGRRPVRAGRPRPRRLRAGDLHVPEQHRGHRHAVGAHRASSRTSTSRWSRRRTTAAGSPSACA